MNAIIDELIDSMLGGQLIPDAVEKGLRELHHDQTREAARLPRSYAAPDLVYYRSIHDRKSDPLDNARHVMNRVDKRREKSESEKFKNK
jgi:hypothetical protein